MSVWETLLEKRDSGAIARRLINDCEGFDLEELRDDPYTAFSHSAELSVKLRESLTYGCGGGGYYRAQPPTIYLHPSILRRDNFTLLHEFGHHLQARHPEWAFLLLDLSREPRRRVEEAVCDEVASEILMPWHNGSVVPDDCHPADLMAGFFASCNASRSAVMMKVKKLLPTSARWILVVVDLDGRVQASISTYADPPPAKGSVQQSLVQLAREAMFGPVRRDFPEGIRYSTEGVLDGTRAEAVLDHNGRYLFAALTPAARFGATTGVVYPTYDCSNPACARTFDSRCSQGLCSRCGEPQCPHCGSCGCEPLDSGQTCPRCFLRISPGEIARGTHDCY